MKDRKPYRPGPMTDDMMQHMCLLSVIAIDMVRNPDFDPREQDDREWWNTVNCLQIMGETLVELMRRQGIKPNLGRGAFKERDAIAASAPESQP